MICTAFLSYIIVGHICMIFVYHIVCLLHGQSLSAFYVVQRSEIKAVQHSVQRSGALLRGVNIEISFDKGEVKSRFNFKGKNSVTS